MQRRTRIVIAAAGAVATVAGGSTLARAAVPASTDHKVTACYSSTNPNLRVVDAEAGAGCAAGEQAVSMLTDGMQWAGNWAEGSGPGKVAPGLSYSSGNRGKVVHMDVAPNKFGCTTPRGLWISMTNSYAYPCLESSNWQLVMADPLPAPKVHHARINADHTVATSSAPMQVYGGDGFGYLSFPGIADINACTVTATVGSYGSKGLFATAEPYYGYLLYTTRTADGTWVNAPVDVTAVCGTY